MRSPREIVREGITSCQEPTFRIEDDVPWVGDRPFPWASWVRSKDTIDTQGGFDWRKRGFHLRFENGWLISVMWGSGNYCSNYYHGLSSYENNEWHEESPDAECWGWWGEMSDGPKWPIEDGDVIGYQSPDDVLALIDRMQGWESP